MRLERWALAYLLFPLVLFIGGMFELHWALLGLALLGFAVLHSRPLGEPSTKEDWHPLTLLAALALASLWTWLGGYWGGLPMNSDWGVRLAVLRDLSLSGWPLQYTDAGGEAWLLRAPLAFFLPAATGGLIWGTQVAANLLALWTLFGIILLLLMAVHATGSRSLPGRALLLSMLILLAGGLDLLGWLVEGQPWPELGKHIEWWTHDLQYSSTTTGLFWVPNHALPAWLGIGWIWLRRETGLSPAQGLGLLTLAMPWSPLTMLGLAPFVAFAVWRARPNWRAFATPTLLAWALLFAVLWEFHTWDSGSVPASWPALEAWRAGGLGTWFSKWVVFSLLEWGWLALLLWRLAPSKTDLMLAALVLLVLPLMRLGPGNDWVMRVGQPALCWLWLLALHSWLQPSVRSGWRWILLGLGLLGSASGVQELAGSRIDSVRSPAGGQQLWLVTGGAPHYMARLPPQSSLMAGLLREPNRALAPVDAESAKREKMRDIHGWR